MKQYLVNNPLILQDENGDDYRVERGEVIALTDVEYAEVAAHVTLLATAEQNPPDNSQENQAETQTQSEQTSETSANSEQTQSEQKQSENPQENQTETTAETTDKPKRGQSKAKDAE